MKGIRWRIRQVRNPPNPLEDRVLLQTVDDIEQQLVPQRRIGERRESVERAAEIDLEDLHDPCTDRGIRTRTRLLPHRSVHEDARLPPTPENRRRNREVDRRDLRWQHVTRHRTRARKLRRQLNLVAILDGDIRSDHQAMTAVVDQSQRHLFADGLRVDQGALTVEQVHARRRCLLSLARCQRCVDVQRLLRFGTTRH